MKTRQTVNQRTNVPRMARSSGAKQPMVLTTFSGMRKVNVVDTVGQRGAMSLGEAVQRTIAMATSKNIK